MDYNTTKRKSWDGALKPNMKDTQLREESNRIQTRRTNVKCWSKNALHLAIQISIMILAFFVNDIRHFNLFPSDPSLPIDIMNDMLQMNQLASLLDTASFLEDLPYGLLYASMGFKNLATMITNSDLESREEIAALLENFVTWNVEAEDLVTKRNAATDLAIRRLM